MRSSTIPGTPAPAPWHPGTPAGCLPRSPPLEGGAGRRQEVAPPQLDIADQPHGSKESKAMASPQAQRAINAWAAVIVPLFLLAAAGYVTFTVVKIVCGTLVSLRVSFTSHCLILLDSSSHLFKIQR